MKTRWTDKARQDLARVYKFNVRMDAAFAKRIAQMLNDAPKVLLDTPRIGERLEKYDPREIRRLTVGGYEMRYEVKGELISIVRLWHTREDR